MAKIAVLGHGVVGSGVLEVLRTHPDSIARRAQEEITVKRILDIRDFPDLPYSDIFTKDFNDILEDVDTLAGLILELNGTFPKQKELFHYKEYNFQAEEMNKRRIVKIRYIPPNI